MLRRNLASLLILLAWSGPLRAQDVARVEIQPSAVEASVGDTVRLIATVYDNDNNVVNVPIQWFTSYEVGTIDANGMFVAYAVGEREIGVMVGEQHTTIPVAVRPLPPASIELAMPTTSIAATSLRRRSSSCLQCSNRRRARSGTCSAGPIASPASCCDGSGTCY